MDSNPVSKPTFIQSLRVKFKNNPLVFFLPVLVILAGILGYRYSAINKSPLTFESLDYSGNRLFVANARLDKETSPRTLTVVFNSPVDADRLFHYFSLAPDIPGHLVIDENNDNTVHFRFDDVFTGKFIAFSIKKGFTSLDNKALLDDYNESFTVEQALYEEPYSRVISYPAGKEIVFSGREKTVEIYKSDAYRLLSFLTYKVDDTDSRGGVYDGTYTQKTIKHSESEKVQSLSVDAENRKLLLDPGVYYLEPNLGDSYFAVVSDFGVALRQDDQKVVLGAFNMADGTKITGPVTFGLYNLKNGVNLLRDFTYSEENNSVPLVYPTKLDVAIGIYKDQVAFVPVELPSSFADINVSSNLDTDSQIFIYTDRPIYKPGDTVFVKGIVRQDSDSLYKVPAAGTNIYLRGNFYSDYNKFKSKTLALDDYGSFYTDFIVPEDSDTTYSYIQASAKPFGLDGYGTSVSFEILKYVKPEFEIKTAAGKSEQLRSDRMKFTISGNYFDGKPLENKEVEFTVYTDNFFEIEKAVYNKNFNVTSFGGMCGGGGFEEYFGVEYQKGKVTLNEKGEAEVEVNADPKSVNSQKITLVAKLVDKNNNDIISAVNTVVHAAEFNIFFMPSAENYISGEEVVAPFYAESLMGEKIKNTDFSYKLIEYRYEPQISRQTVLAEGAVTSDENGKGIIKFDYPKDKAPGNKLLFISAKDSKDNLAQNQKSIIIEKEKAKDVVSEPSWGNYISQTYLKISSNQNSFKVGDEINLKIDSPKELDVLLSLERGRIYEQRYLHLNEGNNDLNFVASEDLSPSITVVFSFFADSNYHSEGLSLNVPAMHKLLQIDLSANKNIYNPNETAELLIKTRDSNGAPVAAQMSVGVVDKAIYALRKSSTPPIHSSFYYFRPRRTNASSSLTGMGDWGGRGGGGGGGASNPGSNADILFWDPNIRTDITGEVRVPIPLLGHETTWKVQVLGNTLSSDVGQADTEFVVTSDVKGAKTKKGAKR